LRDADIPASAGGFERVRADALRQGKPQVEVNVTAALACDGMDREPVRAGRAAAVQAHRKGQGDIRKPRRGAPDSTKADGAVDAAAFRRWGAKGTSGAGGP
jgi:hypothetical protein